MSHEDKLELAELLEAGKEFDRKWNIRKIVSGIATIIICMVTSTWYLAQKAENWSSWRTTYTKTVDDLVEWKDKQQTAANTVRAEKNRSIVVKPYNQ